MPTLPKNTPVTPRFRPVGLVLALFAAAFVYGLFPMVPLGMAALIRLRGHEGVNADVKSAFFQPDVILGLVILVLCVLAWRGRPTSSRWALILGVWIDTIYHLYEIFHALAPQTNFQQVSGDLSTLSRSVLPCEALILVIIPIYITWYMNRAPARAFYAPDA